MQKGGEQLKLVETMDKNPEFRLTLAEAKEFATKATFQVTKANKFSSCVDGRYPQNEAGAIALAGADTGFLEAAYAAVNELKKEKGAMLSDEVILNTVYSLVGGKNKFQYHGDHAGHEGPAYPLTTSRLWIMLLCYTKITLVKREHTK